MEIWIYGKEWLPILISKIHIRYRILWGEIEFEIADETKAYGYVLRMIRCIREKTGVN